MKLFLLGLFNLLWLAAAPAPAQQVFEDVPPSSPYYHTANRMMQLGITIGCRIEYVYGIPKYYFCPDQPITRWQMSVFVIRAIYGGDGFSYPATPQYFTDVGPELYYYPHVQKMKQMGITAGCTETTYCPEGDTLRFQAAVFGGRAAQRKEGNPFFLSANPQVSLDNDFETHSANPWFADVPSYEYFFRFVQRARDLRVITGSGYWGPYSSITRGEMSYFIVHEILDEFPPPNGNGANPRLASPARLHGAIAFVPFDLYENQNANPAWVRPCSTRLTVRECFQRVLQNLARQGVTGVRILFGLMGGAGSTALVYNGYSYVVRQEWLDKVSVFFSGLRAAGITQVALTPAMYGQEDDPTKVTAMVTGCAGEQVNMHYWRTAPFGLSLQGGDLRPYRGGYHDAYNCSPGNPFFVGWNAIYDVLDKMITRAAYNGVTVFELDGLNEINLTDFEVEARFIYDNRHGSDTGPCEIGRVWQNTSRVFECLRRVMELNGLSPGSVTYSVTESRSSNGTDCLSVYGDSARVLQISALHSGLAGGRIGREYDPFFPDSGDLECGGNPENQVELPFGPQPQPGLIDLHTYVCVGMAENPIECDLSKSGPLIEAEMRLLSNGVRSFQSTNGLTGAQVVFGETYANEALNEPAYPGTVTCIRVLSLRPWTW